MEKNWAIDWFSSPYYDLLYEHRDKEEAENFLNNLIQHLNVQEGARILDIGCGKGRHALYLAKSNYDVVGIDVVEGNIDKAREHSSNNLQFYVHDMREPIPLRVFEYILNIFTSFGYFETEEENLLSIRNIHHALKEDGILVIDFLNSFKIEQNLVPENHVIKEDVEFHVKRRIEEGFVVKEIEVNDKGKVLNFIEKVRLLKLKNFEEYFHQHPFRILNVFGDYNLNPYKLMESERLIFIAQKLPYD